MDETTVEETAAELPPIEIPDVEQANQYVEMLMEMAVGYGPRLALALATLFIGLWVINAICRGIRAGFEKSGMESSLRSFLNSLISIGLKILLVISVASMVGIETTSFIAVLGAAGLAVGLAFLGECCRLLGCVFRPGGEWQAGV